MVQYNQKSHSKAEARVISPSNLNISTIQVTYKSTGLINMSIPLSVHTCTVARVTLSAISSKIRVPVTKHCVSAIFADYCIFVLFNK